MNENDPFSNDLYLDQNKYVDKLKKYKKIIQSCSLDIEYRGKSKFQLRLCWNVSKTYV